MSRAPSSSAGRMCEWRSITRAVPRPFLRRLRAQQAARLRRFDLEDLELELAARRSDLDGLALLLADDRLAHRRLVRQLVLRRVGLRRPDNVVRERLLRVDVAELPVCPGRDYGLRNVLLVDHTGVAQALFEGRDPVL